MAFIKEESEDIRIAEVFSIKHEDTEEQTGPTQQKHIEKTTMPDV